MSLISVSSSYMDHVHQTFTHSFTLIFHVSHISFIFIHGTRPPDIHSLVHTNFSCVSYQFHSSYMEHAHQIFTHSFTLIFHVSHMSFIFIHATRPPDIHSLLHTNFSCLSYQFHLHTCNTSTRHSLTPSH